MFFEINQQQEAYLLSQPETGMGYQVIDANPFTKNYRERFIVLNSTIAIEMDGTENTYIQRVMKEGFAFAQREAHANQFIIMNVLTEREFKNATNQFQSGSQKGATENPEEKANNDEWFFRLSAFADDKRLDKQKKKLRPGTFTTMFSDAFKCFAEGESPNERYALPNNLPIKFAFLIEPKVNDILQRGTVQPNFGKKGGGREAYFKNGTSDDTYLGGFDVEKKEFFD